MNTGKWHALMDWEKMLLQPYSDSWPNLPVKKVLDKILILDKCLIIIIIIMEIYKAPTLQLKALNKHTRIMYIKMEDVINKKEEDINKGSRITMQKIHTHTHTHTLY